MPIPRMITLCVHVFVINMFYHWFVIQATINNKINSCCYKILTLWICIRIVKRLFHFIHHMYIFFTSYLQYWLKQFSHSLNFLLKNHLVYIYSNKYYFKINHNLQNIYVFVCRINYTNIFFCSSLQSTPDILLRLI